MSTTQQKAHAKMFVLLIRELSRERDASKRLCRLYTLVFDTPEFQEWFRIEWAAMTTKPHREESAEQARAMRRLLGVGPMEMMSRPSKRRKSTLH